jgi:hypothetical protein
MAAVLVMIGTFVQPAGWRAAEAATVLPAAGTISGHVTDDRGAPIPSTIRLEGQSTQTLQTRPDGTYTASNLAAGSYRVSVQIGYPLPPSSPSFVRHPELINVSSTAGQVGVNFELARPAVVTGTVRTESGVPIPDATISGVDNYVVSGPDGRFLTTVDAGPRSVAATAHGYVGGNNNFLGPVLPSGATPINPLSGQVTTVDFTLDSGGSISGRILDAEQVPVAGVTVVASNDPTTGEYYSGSGVTDRSGFYRINGLAPTDYVVTVASTVPTATPVTYYPGTADRDQAALVAVVDDVVAPSIDFSLLPVVDVGPSITVRSVSPRVFRRGTTTTATLTGTGFVPGATLRVDPYGTPPQPHVTFIEVIDSEHLSVNVTTPVDAPLGADGGIFVAQLGQYAECSCALFVADATSTFGMISGVVTRSSDGAPLESVTVTAESFGGSSRPIASTRSSADGHYELGPLAPGDYAVRFSTSYFHSDLASEFYADAHTDATSTPVAVAAATETTDIDAALEVSPDPTISSVAPDVLFPGTVTEVTLTGTNFGINTQPSLSLSSYSSLVPRVVGREVLSSNEMRLSIETDPLSPSAAVGIYVYPQGGGIGSGCSCLSIAGSPDTTGAVLGVVSDPSGAGLRSVRVTAVADGQTQPAAHGWTTDLGTYALRLPPGTYSLQFEDLSGATAELSGREVILGQVTDGANTTLTTATPFGGIAGVLTDRYGQSLQRALVQVTNMTTDQTTATLTSPFGSYQFTTLAPAEYTVEFSNPGYQTRWYDDAATSDSATPVVLGVGAQVREINASLPLGRRPLSLTSIDPSRLVVGESVAAATITGSGFAFGDVTNLTFNAGPGVSITPIDASPDTIATVSIMVDPNTLTGPRDVVVTRDDGQVVMCSGCLQVYPALSSIGGTVVSANSTPVQPAVVTATSLATNEMFQIEVGQDGVYLLDRLPFDDYRVGFTSSGFVNQWYDKAETAAAALNVGVAAAPVTGIDATMQPARKYLSLYGVNPYSVQQGAATEVMIFGSGFLDGGVTGLAFDGGDGVTIEVTEVIADSVVSATLSVTPDAVLGTHRLTVTRSDGSVTCYVCLQVVQAPGGISGRLTGTGGLAYGWIEAYIVGEQYPTRYAYVQPDGTYSFDSLAAGSYQLRFSGYGAGFQYMYDTEWWNDAPTREQATTVTVSPLQVVTGIDTELQVTPTPLTLNHAYPNEAYQGSPRTIQVSGSGFQIGTTGLRFSAGDGVDITVDQIISDSYANITIIVGSDTPSGARDLVVTRDNGDTATCTLCINIVPAPPGGINGVFVDADTSYYVYGTATITRVGDVTPTWSGGVYGYLSIYDLLAGEYDVTFDAAGYEPFASRVTVAAGLMTNLSEIRLNPARQPLSYGGPAPMLVYQGYDEQLTVVGSGFRSGGVTDLTFSATPDVTITINSIISDSSALITVSAAPDALEEARDFTVTRDDGMVAVCTSCLIVSAPAPGSLSGTIIDNQSFIQLAGTVTATSVADPTIVSSTTVNGYFSLQALTPGDYDLVVESAGYLPSTQRVSIRPGKDTYTTVGLDLPRQPLTISTVYPETIFTGSYYSQLQIQGSGFLAGGVVGLTVSIGEGSDIAVQSLYVASDALMYVYVNVAAQTPLSSNDITVTRELGELATCTGCVTVRPAPGYVNGYVSETGSYRSLPTTVIATRVGETEPTATVTTPYGYYQFELPPGDYLILAESEGYAPEWWMEASSLAEAIPVTVAAWQYSQNINFGLDPIPYELTIDSVGPVEVRQGESSSTSMTGTGFLHGRVTGLKFDAGEGVLVTVEAVYSDTQAAITISATDQARLGLRDLIVSRDDGETATCIGCTNVVLGAPVLGVIAPQSIRVGLRTITVSGLHLQTVVNVTESSGAISVQSFVNNADGSVSVTLRTTGRSRGTHQLTFTRSDSATYTADLTVVK